MAAMTAGERAIRIIILVIIGSYMLLPLLAMLEFALRAPGGGYHLGSWRAIVATPELIEAIVLSLELAFLTVIIMLLLLLPTMVWVSLRLPALNRLLEFICLLPLTIPAIVLVVGLAPVYRGVALLLGESALTLTFIYVVLVLPFAYRALAGGLAALDLKTLAEAALSLGSSWPGVIWRIVIPNLTGAILSAALISVALVLGEFTIASLLNFETLQVVINLLGKRDATMAVAVSLAALLLAGGLLFLLSFVGGTGRRRSSPIGS